MGKEHRQTPQRTRREFIEEPWSRRTGAPQASATRRDRDPDADETHDDIRGRASTAWDGALAPASVNAWQRPGEHWPPTRAWAN